MLKFVMNMNTFSRCRLLSYSPQSSGSADCSVLTCDIKRNGEGTHHGSLHRLGGEGGAGEGGAVVGRRRRELQHRLGLPDGRRPLDGRRRAEVCNAGDL